jgi:cytochrome P450
MLLSSILSYVSDKLFVYQFVVTLTTYSAIRIVLFIRARKRRYQLLRLYGIPGPTPRLLDGSLQIYRGKKCSYLEDVKLKEQYGNVFGFYIGDEPVVIISDLEILRKIFFEKTNSFKERTFVFLDSYLTKSILFAPYHRWKAMRKLISPAFSPMNLRRDDKTSVIDDVIRLMLEYIESKLDTKESDPSNAKTSTNRISVDILSLMKATTLRLITGLAINLPVQISEDEHYVRSLDAYLSQADSGAVILAIRFPFFRRVLSFLANHIGHGTTMSSIHRELNRTIDEGLKELAASKDGTTLSNSSQRPQLINTFIKFHHEGHLSREEVIGNAEALLFAGYDTSSKTLGYTFWLLGKHLDVQEKLRSELMAHGVESKYLEQVINESMRLYPVVLSFTTRLATENVSIDELTLPRGTKVVYKAWLMYRDPDYWPEPDKFDPERFREGVQIHPCAFAPFGFTERKCLGYSLAQLQIKAIICEIICRYRIFTKAPEDLILHTCALFSMSMPSEDIILELERL